MHSSPLLSLCFSFLRRRSHGIGTEELDNLPFVPTGSDTGHDALKSSRGLFSFSIFFSNQRGKGHF